MLTVYCWNIERIRLKTVEENSSQIISTITKIIGASGQPFVITILENKTRTNTVIAGLIKTLDKSLSANLRQLLLYASGSVNTYEHYLIISNVAIREFLTKDDKLSIYEAPPFGLRWDATHGLYSSARIPGIIDVEWTENTEDYTTRIAFYHASGPATGKSGGEISKCFEVFSKNNLEVSLFIGDMNINNDEPWGGKEEHEGSSVINSLQMKELAGSRELRHNKDFLWIGTLQGTTLKRVDGKPVGKLSSSCFDRIYVNCAYFANQKTNYYALPYYDDTDLEKSATFTDHIPVFLKLSTLPFSKFSAEAIKLTQKPLPKTAAIQHLAPAAVISLQNLDFKGLIAILQRQVNQQSKLILQDVTMATQGLDALLQQSALKVSAIEIMYTGAIPAVTADKLTLSGGTCSFPALNLSRISADIIFWLVNGQLAFLLELKLAADWTLAVSFPEVKNSEITQLGMQNAKLVFSTGNIPTGEQSSHFAKGLNLIGTVPLDDKNPFKSLASVYRGFALDQPLTLQGPLSNTGDLVIDLKAGLAPVNLALLPALSIHNGYGRVVYHETFDDKLPGTGYYTGFELDIAGRPLAISARLGNSDNLLLTFGDNDHPLSSLKDIAALMLGNNQDWLAIIPSAIKEQLANLVLQNLTLAIDFTDSSPLTFVETQVGILKPWTIVTIGDKPITLEWLAATWFITSPLSPTLRSCALSFDAAMKLGDYELQLEIDTDSHMVYGGLKLPKKSLSLKEAIEEFVWKDAQQFIPDGLLDFELDNVEVFIELPHQNNNKATTYTCNIYGAFTLFGIKFENIGFSMSYADKLKSIQTVQFKGLVAIGPVMFSVNSSNMKADNAKTLTLTWNQQGNETLNLLAILAEVGDNLGLPKLPFDLALDLTKVEISYDFSHKNLALDIMTAQGFAARLVASSIDKKIYTVFALTISLPNSTPKLPVLGINPVKSLQWVLLSNDILPAQVATLSQTMGANLSLPETGMQAGAYLWLTVSMGNLGDNVLRLPFATKSSHSLKRLSRQATPSNTTAKDSAQWFKIQKALGPLMLNRLGVSYQEKLWLLFDATISLGAIELQLNGLKLGLTLDKLATPEVGLEGLGASYQMGPLAIAGDFYRDNYLPDALKNRVKEQYDGLVLVKVPAFTLSAIGAYSQLLNDDVSFFVFLQLNKPLGGPPYFYVTGLCGGFGYNQQLRTPTQTDIQQFPLLTTPSPVANDDQLIRMASMLVALEGGATSPPWLLPSLGDYWLALGIDFTTCELANSRLLLTAKFGKELEFDLLGRSNARIPAAGDFIFANADLSLIAALKPAEGFMGVLGILDPATSFVLDPSCHLQGGFAFYSWFDGPHAGDFVISLGGYHPKFQALKPEWYPTVPRLRFQWSVSDNLSIDGEAYFALTPSCIMGGGRLNALFQTGDLRAWFNAWADLLMSWKPFYYEVSIGVDMGVSYRLNLGLFSVNLGVEVGADVYICGPAFAGDATIHLWFVSFTVNFGTKSAPAPVTWQDFKALLPKKQGTADLLSIFHTHIEQGLIKDTTLPSQLEQAKELTSSLVRPDQVRLRLDSVIPLQDITVNGQKNQAVAYDETTQLYVKPMKQQIKPSCEVNIKFLNNPVAIHGVAAPMEALEDTWLCWIGTKNLPEAQWGKPEDSPSLKSAKEQLIESQASISFLSPKQKVGPSLDSVINMSAVYAPVPVTDKPIAITLATTSELTPAKPVVAGSVIKSIQAIHQAPALAKRNDLTKQLQSSGLFATKKLSTLEKLAKQANHMFQEEPLISQRMLN